MKLLVISSSLSPSSRSRVLARGAYDRSRDQHGETSWLDTSTMSLPLCDGDTVWNDEPAVSLRASVAEADGILIGLGIYNYSAPAAAKTIVELAGAAFEDKVVGFLCAAGGTGSYMAVLPFANALMLDFRCVIVPQFVYASGEAFDGDRLVDDSVAGRVSDLVERWITMTRSLRGAGTAV